MYPHQELTHNIISSAIEVHKNLGPGLLEAVYRTCLDFELKLRGIHFEKEVSIPLLYKNQKIDRFLRLDYIVENEIILELKSLEKVLPVHEAQLLSYLKLAEKRVGLLINFNVPLLKNGIHRRILGEMNITPNQQKGLHREDRAAEHTEKPSQRHSLNIF